MKKFLSLILCLLLVFCFAACKKDNQKEKISLIHGTTEGNVYTNTLANLTFTLPDGWEFMTDSELLETIDDTDSKITDETLQSDFEKYGLAYDMTAYSEDIRSSVGVIFANTDHEEFEGLSTKELLYTMIEQLSLDTSEDVTEDTVELCGESYLRLVVTAKTGTGETGYATFYGREKGNAVILIVAACTNAFTVSDCEACFG